MEFFFKFLRVWKVEWNGMESGKEIFYICFEERKKVEWKIERKWNRIISENLF